VVFAETVFKPQLHGWISRPLIATLQSDMEPYIHQLVQESLNQERRFVFFFSRWNLQLRLLTTTSKLVAGLVHVTTYLLVVQFKHFNFAFSCSIRIRWKLLECLYRKLGLIMLFLVQEAEYWSLVWKTCFFFCLSFNFNFKFGKHFTSSC
jgi:hypothetical protein